MLWRMWADLHRYGIGMTFIDIGGEITGGKGGSPCPSPCSGAKEFSVFPAGRRARSCRVARERGTSGVAEIAENKFYVAEIPASRLLQRGRRHVLRRDALAPGIDLAQHHQHLLGDDVARDTLALGLELPHVDPHRVERCRALRDDAGMQQRLDQ